MDTRNLQKMVERTRDEILREVQDRLPRKVGIIAVNHFKQCFRDGGWTDNGLHPWKKTRRQESQSPDARYSPLTSRRDHLMRSIQSKPGRGMVTIENPVPYAAIHNEGGNITTHPTVSQKMRRFAWHMAYSLAGVSEKGSMKKEMTGDAAMWKAIALTKKSRLTVTAHMPKRQFMGDSAELRAKITKAINQSMERIKNGITAL